MTNSKSQAAVGKKSNVCVVYLFCFLMPCVFMYVCVPREIQIDCEQPLNVCHRKCLLTFLSFSLSHTLVALLIEKKCVPPIMLCYCLAVV